MAASLLIGSGIVTAAAAAAEDGDWIEDCRAAGFDPMQLACRTCLVLPAAAVAGHHQKKKCSECCQTWKDVERITKPFASAVLVLPSSQQDAELKTFLEEDWDGMVRSRGASRLQQLTRTQQQQQRSRSSMFSFLVAPPPAELLFLEEPLLMDSAAGLDDYYDTVRSRAKEVVQLDGMKRDDLRDMLATLLPA
jgi:hypothetical protein